jgi:hypothetical protein
LLPGPLAPCPALPFPAAIHRSGTTLETFSNLMAALNTSRWDFILARAFEVGPDRVLGGGRADFEVEVSRPPLPALPNPHTAEVRMCVRALFMFACI